ncbi:hypothetical protein C882_1517 [Caenispirillum salinarum AK4]|uniref:Uncharacterized protein n=1 Tax=Caenispirillum salinarum AK4 TaxID=1238182 RepID=K9H381_9PROT|nr:hypothetical protein [Caenispirillum salinarum]EKV32680.1 hypothetical protein C882_1517 [Caenispirillum salinarum AK4]
MVEETPEQARQGRKGKPVAVILMVSLALGLLALIALILWALSGDEPGPEPAQLEEGRVIEGPVRLG